MAVVLQVGWLLQGLPPGGGRSPKASAGSFQSPFPEVQIAKEGQICCTPCWLRWLGERAKRAVLPSLGERREVRFQTHSVSAACGV